MSGASGSTGRAVFGGAIQASSARAAGILVAHVHASQFLERDGGRVRPHTDASVVRRAAGLREVFEDHHETAVALDERGMRDGHAQLERGASRS